MHQLTTGANDPAPPLINNQYSVCASKWIEGMPSDQYGSLAFLPIVLSTVSVALRWYTQVPSRLMICTVILVRRARSWNVVGDLRSTGMCPGKWSGEADTAARNLSARRVSTSKWCGERDGGAAAGPDRGDDGRFGVCSIVD